MLSVTPQTIYDNVCKGNLQVMKRSRRLYLSRDELMEYMKNGRRMTNEEVEEVARSRIRKITK